MYPSSQTAKIPLNDIFKWKYWTHLICFFFKHTLVWTGMYSGVPFQTLARTSVDHAALIALPVQNWAKPNTFTNSSALLPSSTGFPAHSLCPTPPHPKENLPTFGSCINSSGPQGGCWVIGSLHLLAGESFNTGSKGAWFPVVPMNMHTVCTQQSSSSN